MNIFRNNYIDWKDYPLQDRLAEDMPKWLHLEVIGGKRKGANHFSEFFKNKLKDDTLVLLRNEKHFPDIVGFVQKDRVSPKEIIVADVKDEPINVEMIVQVKTYQVIFNAKFACLISTFELPAEKVSYFLNKPEVTEGITIMHYVVTDKNTGEGHFEISAKFKDTIPEAFKSYIPAIEIDVPPKPKKTLTLKVASKIYSGLEVFYYLLLKPLFRRCRQIFYANR